MDKLVAFLESDRFGIGVCSFLILYVLFQFVR